MQLDVYPAGVLQNCITLLTQYKKTGVTDADKIIEDLKKQVKLKVKHRTKNIAKPKATYQAYRPGKAVKCPGCGYQMSPVLTGDPGIRVMGCRKCRYSKVVS